MIPRDKYQKQIATAFKNLPIVVLIGARQVGKTSIMKMYPTEAYKTTLFLNGQDPAVADLFSQMSRIEDYLRIYMNDQLDGMLMIDEFQFVDNITTMLKLLTDKYDRLKVLCSGSSSLDIQQRIDESLAGRVRLIEVLSLSFSEYLLFKDEKLFKFQQKATDALESATGGHLQQYYQEYMVYGGLPRIALENDPDEKIELLKDIYQTYLLHDVRRYVKNEHFVGFDRLLRLLSSQIGSLVNVNELSRESGLSYVDCEKYINLLEKMYVIKMVEPYYTNRRKVITKMKKVYFCDLGLRNVVYGSFHEMSYRADNGSLFENEVMLELKRGLKGDETLYFYRTHNGTEVDFVLDGARRKMAIECKYKKFEKPVNIVALNNFCNDESIDDRYVVNINSTFSHNKVKFVPGIVCDRIVG